MEDLIQPIMFEIAAQTSVGCVRTNNEDNFVVNIDLCEGGWFLPHDKDNYINLGTRGALLVVADGMGGLEAGEVASRMAIDAVKDFFIPSNITDEVVVSNDSIAKFIKEAIVAADRNIKQHAALHRLKAMGTTIVVVWMFGEYANIGWCGDSRAYLLSSLSGLLQLTKDHSYVQELVDCGKLLPELAFDHPNNNIITRCLGSLEKVAEPDVIQLKLQHDDYLLLCTDGLHSMLRDKEIEAIIQEYNEDVGVCLNQLMKSALDAGGYDNVTLILCHIFKESSSSENVDLVQTQSLYTQSMKSKKNLRKKIVKAILLLLFLGGVWEVIVAKWGSHLGIFSHCSIIVDIEQWLKKIIG